MKLWSIWGNSDEKLCMLFLSLTLTCVCFVKFMGISQLLNFGPTFIEF
uniref:Uncharacterized protein n=1 Tax=Rhizophora mucronata TaxID=61149 RepID=A0A2P2PMM4_RHIMU